MSNSDDETRIANPAEPTKRQPSGGADDHLIDFDLSALGTIGGGSSDLPKEEALEMPSVGGEGLDLELGGVEPFPKIVSPADALAITPSGNERAAPPEGGDVEVGGAVAEAATVMAPPMAPSPGAEDATLMAPPEEAATVMAPPMAPSPGAEDATLMAPPDEEGATVVAPMGAAATPEDATRVAPADDATRPMGETGNTVIAEEATAVADAPPAPRPSSRHPDALPLDHDLLWYRIEKVLGVGGFGITYKALDTKLDTAVAIKEYLPTQLMTRAPDLKVIAKSDQYREVFEKGRDDFLEEARTLARFKHTNIVRVLTFFEEHGTAYMVMEYEEGESLSAVLKRQRVLEEPALVPVVMPLLQGLMALHDAGFIHRDIKPDNIFIRQQGGTPVLLDFGAARRTGVDENMTAILTPHYAPLEQYFQEAARQGPWTDIYAMAAVMYHAVSGKKPPQAPQRSDAIMRGLADPLQPAVELGEGRYSKSILKAIDLGLAVVETNRPKTIKEWLAAVEEESDGQAALSLQNLMGEGEGQASPRTKLAMGLAALLLVGAVGFTAWNSLTHRELDPALVAAQQLAAQVRDLKERAEGGDIGAMATLAEHYIEGRGVNRDRSVALGWFRRAAEAGDAAAQYRVGMAFLNGDGAPRDDDEAAHWFRLAAEAGEPRGEYRYGEALELGAGVEPNPEEALTWYAKAAEQGEADAQFRLGLAHETGQGREQDDRAALDYYLSAAAQGQPEAQLRLGALFAAGRGTQADVGQAAEWYRQAAEQGLAEAQYLYALQLARGDGVIQNLQQAADWYARAAEQGYAPAQLELGIAYESGVGIVKDVLQAIKWYRQAAEQNLVEAQLILAAIYYNGEAVAPDMAEAARWFRRAAELGDPQAQNSLGAMYQAGQGVARDPVEAKKWFSLAADQGDAEAENNLGLVYESGLGVRRDYGEAVRWYLKAAAKGHPVAQRNLGWMYEEGRGVAQNYTEAAKWYSRAAEQGDMRAQNTLGWMFEEGRGVPRDLIRAHAWYTLAAVQDYADARRNMELLGRRLNDDQRSASQSLARAWLEARSAANGGNPGGG